MLFLKNSTGGWLLLQQIPEANRQSQKNKNISEKNYKNLNPEGQRCEDDRSDVGVVSSQFQQCLDGGTVLSWVAKGRTVLLQKDRS